MEPTPNSPLSYEPTDRTGSTIDRPTRGVAARISRRNVLAVAGLGVLGASVSGAFGTALSAQAADSLAPKRKGALDGWGPLKKAGRELALPAGFSYRTFGRAGSVMSDGLVTPVAHDGQAVFSAGRGRIRVLRNHEIDLDLPGVQAKAIGPDKAYDRTAPAGVTSSLYDLSSGHLIESFLVLNGTLVNCSGSPTPWGSWLTCEETLDGVGAGFEKPHGYVFEVPKNARGVVTPHPIKAMGRFEHECAPVDPHTGFVYMTEDNGDPGDGFYRYVPDVYGKLARGGQLQMLAVTGSPHYNTVTNQRVGETLPCHWVDIDDPDPSNAEDEPAAVYFQGRDKGGARFMGLEGAVWAEGCVTFCASESGNNEEGQIWRYEPVTRSTGLLTLLFESPNAYTLNQPDSIEAGKHGLVVLAEDGDGEDEDGGDNWLRVLTPQGRIANLAKVIEPLDLNYWNSEDFPEPGVFGASEMSGMRWTADGKHLVANVQYPGVTCVISGPFDALN